MLLAIFVIVGMQDFFVKLMFGSNRLEASSVVCSCGEIGVFLATKPLAELFVSSRFPHEFVHNPSSGLLQSPEVSLL